MKKRKQKQVEYTVDSNGCWVCTSHRPNKNGYVYIHVNGISYRLNRYVYQLYHGEIPSGLVVRHTCDNRKCMNPEHLILGTQRQNMQDMVNRHRQAVGELNGKVKLTEEQVKEIQLDSTTKYKDLAKKYGVSITAIGLVKRNVNWRHLVRDETTIGRGKAKGEHHGNSKITDEIALAIFKETKLSQRKIGEKYNINQATVWRIKNGLAWTHATRPAATKN